MMDDDTLYLDLQPSRVTERSAANPDTVRAPPVTV